MREAIGSTRILFIVVTIVIATMMLLAASIGYTKAFKARNAIINVIQKNAAYGLSATDVLVASEHEIHCILSGTAKAECNGEAGLGYKVNVGTAGNCSGPNKTGELDRDRDRDYAFCVYHMQNEDGSQYYRVQTFIYFELPVFGRNDRFAIPLYADTYTFYKTGND